MTTELQNALLSQAQHIVDFEDWNGEELADIVYDWIYEGVSPNPQSWMDGVLPYEGCPPPANKAVQVSTERWFHSNPKQFLRAVLQGNVNNPESLNASRRSIRKMTRDWRQLMKGSSPSIMPISTGNRWNILRRPNRIMRQVKSQEVRDTDQGEFAAAGPDGVEVLDWEKVPEVVRAVYYNLVLANNCFSAKTLQHRAVFINDSDEDDDCFFEYVTVPNVAVRQLHRILLMRLKEEMEVDNRRRLNLMVMATLLHSKTPFIMAKLVFYRAYASLKQDAVYETLRRAGATTLADYLSLCYGRIKVLFEDFYPVKMRRGIPLGDPLSETILTMVLDVLLASIVKISSVDVNNTSLTALGLGDEVLLFGKKTGQLQAALNALQNAAAGVGLSFDCDKCLVSGAYCQPPRIVLQERGLDQMVLGDQWRCFGRLFDGGRFLSPVKVLRVYLHAINEVQINSGAHISALKRMINEYVDAEIFFTAPSVGELRTADRETFEIACCILNIDGDDCWNEVFGIADYYCHGLTTIEETAPFLLKKALKDLEEWREYVCENSALDVCTRSIENSAWCKQAWQLANLCDSSSDYSDEDPSDDYSDEDPSDEDPSDYSDDSDLSDEYYY